MLMILTSVIAYCCGHLRIGLHAASQDPACAVLVALMHMLLWHALTDVERLCDFTCMLHGLLHQVLLQCATCRSGITMSV